MVDAGRLAALLERVGSELVELTALAEMTAQDLRMDRFALPAAKYRLVVALEAAIDAAEHLIASEGLRASTSFADTFAVLGESGHLDGTLSEAMQDAARFRNLLVHGYADVDDERVVGILKTRLGDLERFRRSLAAVLGPDD